MVTVRFAPDGLRVAGHAGYGTPGGDVVCAACSALCAVMEARHGGVLEPGRGVFRFQRGDATAQAVRAAFEALARQYPAYVRLETDAARRACPETGAAQRS